ncbi:hypothetical protein [Beijerinckia mobilis]|uniref:hypothetical protein n=1 Tax=Beijerinckia mobilis TaxID=231434 RepID=UPI00068D6E96|nr:hypothetical protein [Beijerinckia mobilis]
MNDRHPRAEACYPRTASLDNCRAAGSDCPHYRRPALLSLVTVQQMRQEAGHSHFDHSKIKKELGMEFKPMEETLADEVGWYRSNGMLPA